jgi:hypothetical protein
LCRTHARFTRQSPGPKSRTQEDALHVEPPEHPISSFRAFISHYLMIVLSILTALALEEGAQFLHHREAARETQEKIRAELRDNLDQVRSVTAQDRARIKELEDFERQLLNDIQAGKPDADIVRTTIEPHRALLHLGYFVPSLRHEAWDVGVADQSLAYLPGEPLRRYSAVYADQRDLATLINTAGELMTSGGYWVEFLVDLKLGRETPVQTLRFTRQLMMSLGAVLNNLESLDGALADALQEGPGHAAAPASGASR